MNKRKLNVGCGRDIKVGWDNLDRMDLPGVNLITDLDHPEPAIAALDDTYDEIYTSHILEHITHILPCMEELHRVAKPGAQLHIRVPHGASEDAFEDPTHVRYFFPRSFMYFGQPYYHLADYGYRGDWRLDQIQVFLKPEHKRSELVKSEELDYMKWLLGQWNSVNEMYAVMTALKPIRKVTAPHDKPRMGLTWAGDESDE
jgi:hypothetical protein